MFEYINTKRKLHHSFVSIPIYIQISHAKNEYSNPHHKSNKIFKDSPSNLHQLENSYKNLFLTKMIYIQLKHGKRNRRFSTMFENIRRRGSKRNRARKRVEPRNGGAAAAAAAAGAGATPVRGPGPGLCAPRSVEFHGVYSFQTTNPRAVGCPVAALLAA